MPRWEKETIFGAVTFISLIVLAVYLISNNTVDEFQPSEEITNQLLNRNGLQPNEPDWAKAVVQEISEVQLYMTTFPQAQFWVSSEGEDPKLWFVEIGLDKQGNRDVHASYQVSQDTGVALAIEALDVSRIEALEEQENRFFLFQRPAYEFEVPGNFFLVNAPDDGNTQSLVDVTFRDRNVEDQETTFWLQEVSIDSTEGIEALADNYASVRSGQLLERRQLNLDGQIWQRATFEVCSAQECSENERYDYAYATQLADRFLVVYNYKLPADAMEKEVLSGFEVK